MTNSPVRRLIIVGGGTAGWMMAAAASRFLQDGRRKIVLIESDEIGTVGVGEASIPPILGFNARLGLDEAEFMRTTGATYKLGIEFAGWTTGTNRYFHPFGTHGRDLEGIAFHQIWLKLRNEPEIGALGDYSMAQALAYAGRFQPPSSDARSPFGGLAYAYHFDALLYARYLRSIAEKGSIERIEGRVVAVEQEAEAGAVRALRLSDGRRVEGDLFVDCSGFRSLLIGEQLQSRWIDWSGWLPCDRAIAMPAAPIGAPPPFTTATAHKAGWLWRIPLQHRTGTGIVYSSDHLTDDDAESLLRAHATPPGAHSATHAARRLRFATGHRERFWDRNVVAIGLAAGFLEPLESTSIHLIQFGISLLLSLFPGQVPTDAERREYNRLMTESYESIRDFLILHYHANQRPEPFWRDRAAMILPASLQRKLALFREKGRVFRYGDELFVTPNWVSVLLGQGIEPNGYDPMVDALEEERVRAALRMMRAANAKAVADARPHEEALTIAGAMAKRY